MADQLRPHWKKMLGSVPLSRVCLVRLSKRAFGALGFSKAQKYFNVCTNENSLKKKSRKGQLGVWKQLLTFVESTTNCLAGNILSLSLFSLHFVNFLHFPALALEEFPMTSIDGKLLLILEIVILENIRIFSIFFWDISGKM